VSQPVSAYLMTKAMAGFYEPDREKMMETINLVALGYLGLAASGFLSQLLTSVLFGYGSSYVSARIKYLCFESLLCQEPAFFEEKPEQAPGAVIALITEKTWEVTLLTGQQLATRLNGFASLAAGCILGLVVFYETQNLGTKVVRNRLYDGIN
jgi:ATP-binding cassette, subfamily B (MDR/TAP), member 1